MKPMFFESSEDAIDYIVAMADKEQAIVEIFQSKFSDEPKNFRDVLRHITVMEQKDLGLVILKNFDKFMDVDLNLYKFKLITGFRGPLVSDYNVDDFIEDTVKKEPFREGYQIVAKHKDFPFAGKEFMAEYTNDITYVVLKEAQELFIF